MTSLFPIPYDHIVATDFDGGEGVLIDLNAKRYYQLNETAMAVWRGLEQKLSPPEIAGRLTEAYEVSAEQAEASVERLLREFQDHKLVQSG